VLKIHRLKAYLSISPHGSAILVQQSRGSNQKQTAILRFIIPLLLCSKSLQKQTAKPIRPGKSGNSKAKCRHNESLSGAMSQQPHNKALHPTAYSSVRCAHFASGGG